MNYRALLSATAIIAASVTSTTPANASAPPSSPPTQADMQTVCDTLDSDGAGTDFQVILTQGAVEPGALTFDLSTITDNENTRVADHSSSSSPFGPKSFFSVPGRHGGSVNLFATIGYPGITYSGSFVDQNADRTETDVYHFSCQLQHYEVVGTHTVPTPPVPPEGFYTNPGTNPSGGEGSCQGINNANPHWGHDIGACIWHETAPGQPGGTETVEDFGWVNQGTPTSESLTDGPYFVDNILYALHVAEANKPVTETNNAPYFAGDGVVCNNPGKKGGTWTAQNGWTDMTKCTTAYFNVAPYISGANVFSSNSLPSF